MRVQSIGVGMWGIWVEIQKYSESGGDAGNQGGTLSIAVEVTWNSNGNDELKDWREVK